MCAQSAIGEPSARELLELLGAFVLRFGPSEQLYFASAGWLELAGYSLVDLEQPALRASLLQPVLAMRGARKPRTSIQTLRTRAGRTISIEWRAHELAESTAGNDSFVAVGIDVTDRIAAQQRLGEVEADNRERATQKLEEAVASGVPLDDEARPTFADGRIKCVTADEESTALLREREALHAAVFESSADAKVVIDVSDAGAGCIAMCNSAFAALVAQGDRCEEPCALVGRNLVDVLPTSLGVSEERCQNVLEAARRAARERTTLTGAREPTRPDGRTYGDVRCTPIVVSDTAPRFVLVTARNLTAERSAERALRQSERRWRDVFEQANDAMLLVDVEGRMLDFNGAAERLLGYAREELLQERTSDLAPLDDPMKLETIGERGALHREGKLRRKHGEWIEAEVHAQRLEDGTIHVVIRDLSAHKRAEANAARAEQRLLDAHRIAGLGAWELDLVTGESWWSDEQYELAGVPRGTPLTQGSYAELVHPEDRAKFEAAVLTAIEAGRSGVEFRIVRPDGAVRHVFGVASRTVDESGRPQRLAGTNQDVTERHLAERKIASALAEKETLLREIHHRVKNNLQIISSLLHFQAKKVRSAEDAAAFADGRARLLAMILVHEMLYRSDNLHEIDVTRYLAALVSSLVESMDGSSGVRACVEGAAVRLPIEIALPVGMIICELVTNAMKYAYPERTGRVATRVRLEGNEVLLEVGDEGVGLPAALDVTSCATFGWTLIRNLAMQLDATICVQRSPGTVVRIRFRRPPSTNVPPRPANGSIQ